jgi:hypothetical protein
MLGMQFTDIADKENKVDIGKLVGMPDIPAKPFGDSQCARIMTLRSDGFYDFFYYINDAFDANENEVQGDVWTDVDGFILTMPITKIAEAFWCYGSEQGKISVTL